MILIIYEIKINSKKFSKFQMYKKFEDRNITTYGKPNIDIQIDSITYK